MQIVSRALWGMGLIFLTVGAWAAEPTPPITVQVPAQEIRQAGKPPTGATPATQPVLSNEPPEAGGTCVVSFDLEAVAQKMTPLARLNLTQLTKVKVSRLGQKPGVERGGLHVFVFDGARRELAGATAVKPVTEYKVDVTEAVSAALAQPAGKRRLSLEVVLTGKPAYFEIYQLGAAALEIFPADNWTNDWEQRLVPIDQGPTVYRESVMAFAAKKSDDSTVKLLYPPKRIVEVINLGTGEKLTEGKDWVLRDGRLVFPAGTTAPVQIISEFFARPPSTKPSAAGARASAKPPPLVEVRLTEGIFYHQHQMEVTYEPAQRDWKMPPVVSSSAQLPKTMAKLRAKQPVRIVLFGDSISFGHNASKLQGAWPYQPGYGELLAWKLKQIYGGPVELLNHSRAGARSSTALLQAQSQVGWFKPDLCILAYGMNDRADDRRDDYKPNMEKLIDIIHEMSPETEFIFVTSMLNNPKRTGGYEPLRAMRGQALTIQRPNMAFADVTGTHDTLCARKDYLDMSGNGSNHPNDWLHRVYAMRILELLQ